MENFQGNYSRANKKIKVPPGMKTLKLIIGSDRYHGSSVSSASYDSENVDLNAPILRYLCGGSPMAGKIAPRGSRSPLAAVENLIDRSSPPMPPEVYRTPVKAVEGEEVLVMDAVPLKRSSRFSGSESSGSSGKSLFKAENLSSSEDSGKCRYTSKGQYTRVKEDDHPSHLNTKNKTEMQPSNTYGNSSGLSTHKPNSVVFPQIVEPASTEVTTPQTRIPYPAPAAYIPVQRPLHYVTPTPQIPTNTVPSIPGQTPSPAKPMSSTRQMSADAPPFIPRNFPPLPLTPAPMPFPPPLWPPTQITSPGRPVTPFFPPRYATTFPITVPPTANTPTGTASRAIPLTPPKTASRGLPITPPKTASRGLPITPPKTASRALPITPPKTASRAEPVTPVQIVSPATSVPPTRPGSSITGSQNSKSNPTTAAVGTDWSPQDDGIEVTLPDSSPVEPSSRQSVNIHIDSVLSGRGRKRLPAFSEFCPE